MSTPSTLVIAAGSVAPQPWRNGGGQTRELLAWPDAARWQLRISRADITASGPLSAYPGVERWFEVLSGEGLVLHMPTADRHTQDHLLQVGHIPLHFDGALAPGCTLLGGPTQDLNLMVRSGQGCMLPVEPGQAWRPHMAMCGLYTSVGGRWSCGPRRLNLPAHSLLWLAQAPAQTMRFRPNAATAAAKPEDPPDEAPDSAWWLGFTPESRP